ncbi:MAG: hypothetical protein K6U80_07900 [Firmicutes bacterium]|nr:hypothetical protein [Bacillota bacterium]
MIRNQRPAIGKLFDVPNLPRTFVPRPDELKMLREAVLASNRQAPAYKRNTRKIELFGPAGTGKTTLAASLAYDESIQAAFFDGIIWITVGPNPNLILCYTKIAECLDGDFHTFISILQAKAYISNLLADRAILLVLDDLHSLEDLAAFDIFGANCRLLFTTRRPELFPTVDAQKIPLQVMNIQQSLMVLGNLTSRKMDELPPEAYDIIIECDNHPFELTMIGSILHDFPSQWRLILQKLRDTPPAPTSQATEGLDPRLVRAIQLNLDTLEAEVKERYFDLAVFPPNCSIPESLFQALWGSVESKNEDAITKGPHSLEPAAIKHILSRLVTRCLIFFEQEGSYRLPGLLFAFLQKEAKNIRGLHYRLLQAYRKLCPNGWPSGPNDHYFFENFTYHLNNAGYQTELQHLLLYFDWLRAKLEATDINQLITDFDNFGRGPWINLIKGALQLSAPLLLHDKTQLAAQLYGRLLFFKEPEIQLLLDQIILRCDRPWLRPLISGLIPPGGPLLHTLTGHAGIVNTLVITSDSQYIISGAADRSIKVWDLESGMELFTLKGHTGPIKALVVTADGRRVVSGATDKTIKVWDLETKSELRCFEKHLGPVNALVILRDNRRVISGSTDKTIRIWDIESGLELEVLQGHTSSVTALAISPDGQYLVSASADNTFKVWNIERKIELRTIKGLSDSVYALQFLPDGKRFIATAWDKTVKIWDLETGRELQAINSQNGQEIYSLTVLSDGKRALSATLDHNLKLWDMETGQEIKTLPGHAGLITTLQILPDNRKVISGSYDKTLKIWNLESGVQQTAYTGHTGSIYTLGILSDGKRLISGSWDKTIRFWDIKTGAELGNKIRYTDSIYALKALPDGRRIVFVSRDNLLKICNLSLGMEIDCLKGGHSDWINCIAVIPRSQFIITGSRDKTIKIWDLQRRMEVHTLTGHTDWVNDLVVTQDGSALISASRDHTIMIWDIHSGDCLARLSGHSGAVTKIALFSDQQRLISSSADCSLKIWDLKKRVILGALTGHHDVINALAILPNQQQAVSASRDHSLKLWDLNTLKPLASFYGDESFVSCLVFPDDRIIAGDRAGRMHLLKLE